MRIGMNGPTAEPRKARYGNALLCFAPPDAVEALEEAGSVAGRDLEDRDALVFFDLLKKLVQTRRVSYDVVITDPNPAASIFGQGVGKPLFGFKFVIEFCDGHCGLLEDGGA
jgi:hypothetical protein